MRLRAILISMVLLAHATGLIAQVPTTRPAVWRQDLQTLATNLVQLHPNAFFKTPQSVFDQAVSDLDQRIPSLTDAEITVQFSRITALIGDAHTTLYLLRAPGLRRYPVRFQWFSDGLFVTDATPDLRIVLGKRIRSINGVSIAEVMDRIAGVISHENSPWLYHVSESYLTIPEVLYDARIVGYSGNASIEFDDGAGGTFAREIVPLLSTLGVEWISYPSPDEVAKPLFLRDPNFFYWMQYLSASNTIYLKYNSCRDNPSIPLADVFAQILNIVDTQPVNRVIIDLRGNGGGNSSLLIPLISGLQIRAAAGRFDAGKQLYSFIDRGSFSSAVDNAIVVRLVTGKLIGEPTGGKPNGYGEVRNFTLPLSQLALQYSTRIFKLVTGDPDSLDPDVLVPTSSTDYFAGRDPVLESVLGTDTGTSNSRIVIHRGGGVVLEATSTARAVTVAHASIEKLSGSLVPQALAVFRNRVDGVTVSEATVAAQPLLNRGRMFAEWIAPARTGVAFSNPSPTVSAAIDFYFTDVDGQNIGAGSIVLRPGEQIARFLDESPFQLSAGFTGTMTFQSNTPIAATALRGFVNERSEFLITTLPITSLDRAPIPDPVLPHFADGGGWLTDVLLVNSTDDSQSGLIRFLDVVGREIRLINYFIPGRSSRKISTTSTSSGIQTGSIRILPDAGTGSPAVSAVMRFRQAGIVVAEGAILATRPQKSFRLIVDALGGFSTGQPGSLMTGIAIANPGSAVASVTIALSGLDGSVSATTSVTVPAAGQTTLFLKQLPGFGYIQTPFRGLLTLTSVNDVALVAVRARYNERNDFLFATIPPVDDDAATSDTLYVPHLVSGGGYSTQLLLMERSMTGPAIVNIRFIGTNGVPAIVHLQ